MKIAICLSGQLRNYKETFPYFNNFIIKDLNPDIFIYTDKYESEIESLYKPKKFGIQKSPIIKYFNFKNIHSSTNENSLLNQFYKISECNKLKIEYENENNFIYDLVIRCRFDAFFVKRFEKDQLIVNNNQILVPWGWDFKCVSPYAETDIFALGKSDTMNNYSNIFDNMYKYENDILFHPESLIGYNLYVNSINVKTYLINFHFHYPEIDEYGNEINTEDLIEKLSSNGVKYDLTIWENKKRYYPKK